MVSKRYLFVILSRACTSIVTLNKYGEIIHGRNLDYGDPNFLRNITVIIDYQRDSKVIFSHIIAGKTKSCFWRLWAKVFNL